MKSMKWALLALSLPAVPSLAAAEVSYQRYGNKTYGSDGSESYEFAGKQYTRLPGGKEIRCHEFSGKSYCK